MQLKDIGLVVFGAVLTWLYTALTEYRRKRENRKTILCTLHQEIKQIRAAIIIPNYDPNALSNWPYINSVMVRRIINSQLLDPKKDRALIGLLVVLIKHIEEYTNMVSVGNLIIANSMAKPFYEENHKNMFNGELRTLNSALGMLAMVDRDLNKITKLPILEDELSNISHGQPNQESSQLPSTTSK